MRRERKGGGHVEWRKEQQGDETEEVKAKGGQNYGG